MPGYGLILEVEPNPVKRLSPTDSTSSYPVNAPRLPVIPELKALTFLL